MMLRSCFNKRTRPHASMHTQPLKHSDGDTCLLKAWHINHPAPTTEEGNNTTDTDSKADERPICTDMAYTFKVNYEYTLEEEHLM